MWLGEIRSLAAPQGWRRGVFTHFLSLPTHYSLNAARRVSPLRWIARITKSPVLTLAREAFRANNHAIGVLGFGVFGCHGLRRLRPGRAGAKPRLNTSRQLDRSSLMMSKWSAEYDKAKGVEVNYQSIGSGGGVRQMTAKTADFGCTDAPMNEEQLKKANEVGGDVVHLPLVMGAVVPAYNLEEVKEPLVFSGPVLADIFLGKIKKWDDKAIQDLNPGVKLPPKDIGVVHRSDGSGTTYIWVDYLSKVSPEWKKKVGVATSVDWPVGEGAKGTEGVPGASRPPPAPSATSS